jgi:hypothetical protein
MWLRIEALTASLGTMYARLAFDYLAPSARAPVSAIAAKLDKVFTTARMEATSTSLIMSL